MVQAVTNFLIGKPIPINLKEDSERVWLANDHMVSVQVSQTVKERVGEAQGPASGQGPGGPTRQPQCSGLVRRTIRP